MKHSVLYILLLAILISMIWVKSFGGKMITRQVRQQERGAMYLKIRPDHVIEKGLSMIIPYHSLLAIQVISEY